MLLSGINDYRKIWIHNYRTEMVFVSAQFYQRLHTAWLYVTPFSKHFVFLRNKGWYLLLLQTSLETLS